jgi:hypothetical protein
MATAASLNGGFFFIVALMPRGPFPIDSALHLQNTKIESEGR